ncbi:plasmid pRiA4b ORF-3 family protein [Gimesia chilikensis]|uniref:Plasmid pRiA4b ORF-3-like protein n=1 Tax=Gimesia chilikensis TaxID=2605989 RepID=A0A517PYA3_9PLAN|nr:plasmid pRiA4b ORF-3 family protein [Gimesia chilikensis]QDT24361.1 Plasmid pRiA4b ORF-3-like protein [Gimesia chilikensis]
MDKEKRWTKKGETMISLTQAQRKVVADLLPKFADRLKLSENNSRTISFTTKELESIRQNAEVARSHADNGMKRNSLRHIVDAVTKALDNSDGIVSIPAPERLYQFKITLLESQPQIWRRIQIKDSTLDKFHERIQTAMGWTNSHLHQFEINGERYGNPELLDDGFEDFECVDSTITKISDIIPKDGKRFDFLYKYDFGDGWGHEVLFEGCLRAEKGGRYPLCVEGEMNCPPEDVGGIWGYLEFLEALADPKHEQHDDFVEWAGDFDPEEFDAEKTTKVMRRGLPNRKHH